MTMIVGRDADWIRLGLQEHQAGKLAEAEACYRAALKEKPRHADALHLLGVIAHQSGRHDEAVRLIREAIRENPLVAGYHSNCGEALREQGNLDEAALCYETALKLQPEHLEALLNLASVRRSQGCLPDALALAERATRLNPRHPGARNNLGNVLAATGRLAEAIHEYRAAIELRPNYAEAHFHLGDCLRQAGEVPAAAAAYQAGLQIRPDSADGWFGFGNVRAAQERFSDAENAYRRASELNRGHEAVRLNLGLALQEQNRIPDALNQLREAVRLQPMHAEAHFALALASLLSGDFETGFREYEWRWQCKDFSTVPRDFGKPVWDGSDAMGRTILLHAEQGWGDTLQFIRYAQFVAARGAKVIVEAPLPLMRIVNTAPGVDRVVARGEAWPEFDVHASLMSLPRILGTRVESIPAQVPYLFPLGRPPRALAREPGVRNVGLVWAGGPAHKKDHLRSVKFAEMSALLQTPGCRFHSLQVGPRAGDCADAAARGAIVDLAPSLGDFFDTALQMQQLDLVISIDTAVAHLAGALGVPVWILIPFTPDWRWGTTGATSAWYPTAKLFRQKTRGDWSSVIADVACELAAG
jgi:tetratricopeptide (TPR) repeat protein